ncbi:MAG TPA: hypothetical protein VLH19_00365 [Patescibacteria group bacterium]|nr:hypothetical protein [Patescibacteria group bacterium]
MKIRKDLTKIEDTLTWPPRFGISAEDVPTVDDEVQMRMRTGKYESFRVIDTAFAKDGTQLTTYVAIVGVLKSVAEVI